MQIRHVGVYIVKGVVWTHLLSNGATVERVEELTCCSQAIEEAET